MKTLVTETKKMRQICGETASKTAVHFGGLMEWNAPLTDIKLKKIWAYFWLERRKTLHNEDRKEYKDLLPVEGEEMESAYADSVSSLTCGPTRTPEDLIMLHQAMKHKEFHLLCEGVHRRRERIKLAKILATKLKLSPEQEERFISIVADTVRWDK